jgi:hypothetical protein
MLIDDFFSIILVLNLSKLATLCFLFSLEGSKIFGTLNDCGGNMDDELFEIFFLNDTIFKDYRYYL